MRVIFICRNNTGRSQMAAALYEKLTGELGACAGTLVEDPGQLMKDRPGAANTIAVMKEVGVDVSNRARKQLTPDMLEGVDKIISMAEPRTYPDWLKTDPRLEEWNIEDAKAKDLNTTRRIRDEIAAKVKTLVRL
jgi:arsenate reductase (thioredoxin)